VWVPSAFGFRARRRARKSYARRVATYKCAVRAASPSGECASRLSRASTRDPTGPLFAPESTLPGSLATDYPRACQITAREPIVGAKNADPTDAFELRLKQLSAKQQRQQQRRRSIEERRTRREDLRRKVLVGAVVLAKVEQGVIEEADLRRWLDSALTREEDRALFGLDPRAS